MLHKLINSERGSFTLEASLILPIILIFTIVLILLGVAQWEKAALYQQATIVAEQLATTWDSKTKDLMTGNLRDLEGTGDLNIFYNHLDTRTDVRYQDGLYRRISEVLGGGASATTANEYSGSENSKVKLTEAIKFLQSRGATGTIQYNALTRAVTVELRHNLGFSFNFPGLGQQVTAKATAYVAEPVEFMRNVDLALYYGQVITNELKITDIFKDRK